MASSRPPVRSFRHLPTGLKMLIVLTVALLPLGLIAILASIDTADKARAGRYESAQLLAELSANRISSTVARTAIGLRAVATAVAFDNRGVRRCEDTLAALAQLELYKVDYAVVDTGGQVICATGGFTPMPIRAPGQESTVYTRLDNRTGTLSFAVIGANRNTLGVAELSAEAVAALAAPFDQTTPSRITLGQSGKTMLVHDWDHGRPSSNIHRVSADAANGQLRVVAEFGNEPLSISEILSIALPLLMWLAAALFGWLAVNRMALRPMARLQAAVSSFAKDGGSFTLPDTRTPAREIRELGLAFQSVVETLRANERELEEGLVEQRRLTREVHHRVKNNLQVVASLLNLHARAAKTAETAGAYASIQRRVEALAIVQRNLLAESDAKFGISIRPVIAELASGLQQSAPDNVAMTITLDLADVRVQQDVGVPIAFFVTELVELAMNCSDRTAIEIRITAPENGKPATLSVQSSALMGSEEHFAFQRYERVLSGLARQLRTRIERSEDGARISIDISTL